MANPSASIVRSTGKFGFLGFSSIFRYLIKHWYLLLLIIFTLPILISSVHTAIETNNPIHPFLELGKAIFTADVKLGEDINLLSENPNEFYGSIKPESGYYLTFKFYWIVFLKWFGIIGLIYLIFTPLTLIYSSLRYRNTSETSKNWRYSILFFLLYLFIVNIIFVMYKMATGTLTISLPQELSEFEQMWFLFKHLLPLNGLVSFFKYLISLAV